MPGTTVRDPARPSPPHRTRGRWRSVPTFVRQPVVVVFGLLLILLGCVLIVLPGPFTIPPILLGLTVLGTEFAWARRLRVFVMDTAHRTVRELWRRRPQKGRYPAHMRVPARAARLPRPPA